MEDEEEEKDDNDGEKGAEEGGEGGRVRRRVKTFKLLGLFVLRHMVLKCRLS